MIAPAVTLIESSKDGCNTRRGEQRQTSSCRRQWFRHGGTVSVLCWNRIQGLFAKRKHAEVTWSSVELRLSALAVMSTSGYPPPAIQLKLLITDSCNGVRPTLCTAPLSPVHQAHIAIPMAMIVPHLSAQKTSRTALRSVRHAINSAKYAKSMAMTGGRRVDVQDEGLSGTLRAMSYSAQRTLQARRSDSLIGYSKDQTVDKVGEAGKDGEDRCRDPCRQEVVEEGCWTCHCGVVWSAERICSITKLCKRIVDVRSGADV